MTRPATDRSVKAGGSAIMAAAYFLAGWLGLSSAIPPGYATEMWPASGIALGGVLLYGYGLWPGILFGSFSINLWVSLEAGRSIWLSTPLALSIAAGAAIQALAGAWLVRRYGRRPALLADVRDVLGLLMLGGFLGCLVSSTWGVTTLLLGGVIDSAGYPAQWRTWWLGDVLGVVIFAPLALICGGRRADISLRRKISVAAPLCLTFALVAAFFIYARAWERSNAELAFGRRTDALAQALKKELDSHVETLHSIAGFYASSVEVERHEFKNFVTRLLSRHPGIHALSWNPRITDAERPRYEAAARRDGLEDFRISERDAQGGFVAAARRDEYVAAYFIEPQEGNETALGYDVASDPARREALIRARDSGAAAATAPITLVQDAERSSGFLIFLPIYPTGAPHDTREQRRRNLQGYVTGALRISDLMKASLQPVEAIGIAVSLYDEKAREPMRPLYVYRSSPPGAAAAPEAKSTRLQKNARLEVAGRPWRVHFAATREYLTGDRAWQDWIIHGGGLLFSAFLAAFLLLVTGHTAELQGANRDLQKEIAERAAAEAELRRSEGRQRAMLESALDCIVTMDHEGKLIEFNPAAERTFGHPRAAVIGKPLSDIMIPPALRARHQQGLARYRATGEGPILGRKIELTAMRADGSEFPVELAVARIPLEGQPVFTGYIRDISERKQAERQLQDRYQEHETLNQISQAILSAPDLNSTLQKIFDKTLTLGPFDLGMIRLLNPHTGMIEPVLWCGYHDEANVRAHRRPALDPATGSYLLPKILHQSARVVEDVPGCDGLVTLKQEGIRSAIVIPLASDEEALGVFHLGSRAPRRFQREEVRLLEHIGSQIGIAVQKTRLFQETRRNLEQIRMLREVDQAITSSLDLDTVLQLLLDKIDQALNNNSVLVIRLIDRATGVLEPAASLNLSGIDLSSGSRRSSNRHFADIVQETGKLLVVPDVQDDPRTRDPEFCRRHGVTSYTGVPLIAKGEFLGVLSCYSRGERSMAPEALDFLDTVAHQAALAIFNSRLYEEVKSSRSELEATNRRLEQSLRELSGFYAALTPLAPTESVARLMDAIIERLMDATGADAALIRLQAESSAFYFASQRGFPDYYLQAAEMPPPGSALDWVFTTGKPLIAPDIAAEPRLKGKVQLRVGLRSCAMLPLTIHNEVRGVLHLASRKTGYFDEAQTEHLMAIARQMGIALENKQLFDDLRTSRDELARAVKVKDEFLSVMSHELRTPLNVIMGYASLLRDRLLGEINPDQKKTLDKVFNQAYELLSMISGILQVTQIEAQKLRPTAARFAPSQLLDQLQSTYDAPPARPLSLKWDYPPDLPPIRSDSDKLKHILQNLINNALKFTECGHIAVSARYVAAQSALEIRVADTGMGISERDLPVIFEMFRQIDSTETRPFGGVGLGLYIVKKFTELLGGTVTVESETGRGSTFTVTLPYEQPVAP